MTMAWSLILPFRAPLCTKLCHTGPSSLPVPLSHRLPPETDASHGTQMARSRSRTQSHSGSRSASSSPPPQHPDTPAPGPTSPGILRPSSCSVFTPVVRRSPSPSPFYSFKGFHMEEEAFLHNVCDKLGTLGDLYSVAASLGFSHSQVDQFMMSFPNIS